MGAADGITRLRLRKDVHERLVSASYRFDVSIAEIVRKAFMWWSRRWPLADVPLLEPIPRSAPKVGFTGVTIPEEWPDKQSARFSGLIDAYLTEKDDGSISGRVQARQIFGPDPGGNE